MIQLNETDTRTLIDNQLRKLGWIDDPKNTNRNVFKETAKTEEQRKSLEGKRPDYILYQSNSKNPLIIIEAKKENSDLKKGLLQAINYAKKIKCPIVFVSNGIQTKSYHVIFNNPLFKNNEEIDDFIKESDTLKYQETNELFTIDKKVLHNRGELIRIFKKANEILRTEGIRAGSDRFSEFSNILFLKLISEIDEDKESNQMTSHVKKSFRWDSFKSFKGDQLLKFVNNTVIPEFQKAYKDKEVFTALQIQNPETLESIISYLDALKLIDINSDVKGDAFEYFLKQYNSGYKDLGEYFTPRHFIKFMVKLLNPKFGEKVYDPFCGTGGMLIEVYKYLLKMEYNQDQRNYLQNNTIYGGEITNTARVSKMNMILAGDGHNNINKIDSLATPIKKRYDIVITNIPFSQKTKYGHLYDTSKGGGDSVCFQHCIQSLKDSNNVRAAIIVPLSFLWKSAYKEVKEIMYEKYKLEIKSIYSFPVKAFLPYTDSRAAILYITKIKNNKPSDIHYFNIKNDGYTLNNKREKRRYGEGDLDKILMNDYNGVDYLKLNYELVKKKNYNLIDVNYLNLSLHSNKYPTEKLSSLIEEVNIEKKELECDIWSITSKYGFVSSSEMFSEQVFSKDTSSYKLVHPYCFAYSPARVNVGSLNFNNSNKTGAVSPAYTVFKIKDIDKIIHEYLYTLLKTSTLKDLIPKLCYGTVRQSLNFKDFIKISIPLPSIEDQLIISKEFIELEKRKKEIIAKEKEIDISVIKEIF